MSQRHRLIAVLVAAAGVPAAAKEPELTPEWADAFLAHEPLTLVFRKVGFYPPPGGPLGWTFSVNSAGAGEMTIDYGRDLAVTGKPTHQKIEVPAEKMIAIRKALRDQRFFHLAKVDGLRALDSGRTTLTVAVGPLTAIQTFESPNWAGWKGDQLKAAAPAMRIFLAVCDAVDPDGKVFYELPAVKKAVRDQTT